jgi:DNA-directed RNA polymerase subunit L
MNIKTIKNECHTIGNLLRTELLKQDVEFAAYKQTHPLERSIEICIVSEDPDAEFLKSVDSLTKTVKKLKKGWDRIKLD